MTTMLAELYDALREAGASEARSRAAAEALVAYEDRFASVDKQLDNLDHKVDRVQNDLERKIDQVRHDLERKIDELRASVELKIERFDSRQSFMQWQLAILMGGVVTLVIRSFFATH